MTIEAMVQVWKRSPQKGTPLLLMLAIADYVNEDTGLAWPAISTLADKIRMSKRYTEKMIATLIDQGELKIVGKFGNKGTNLYQVLPPPNPRTPRTRGRGTTEPGIGSPPIYRSDDLVFKPIEPTTIEIAKPAISSAVNVNNNTQTPARKTTPALEQEDQLQAQANAWEGVAPQVVNVPQAMGRKAEREAYSERCDMCQAGLSQTQDDCPACGRPVVWVNSPIADKRAKLARGRQADELAKHRREQAESGSPTLAFVLGIARATSVTKSVGFAKGEEQTLLEYERAYGAKLLTDKTNEFKAAGETGRNLIRHLINYLGVHNPNQEKGKARGTKLHSPFEFK